MSSHSQDPYYVVQLSLAMIVGLIHIHERYDGEDSPRHDGRTMRALLRRNLIVVKDDRLTRLGEAYLDMALAEYDRIYKPRRRAA